MSDTTTEPTSDTQTEHYGFHLVDGEAVVPSPEKEADSDVEDKPTGESEDAKEIKDSGKEPEPKGRRVEYVDEDADATAAPEVSAKEFEPALLQRAERWEMTEEQAKGFESPEKLDQFLSQLERHAGLNMLRSRTTQAEQHSSGPPPSSPSPSVRPAPRAKREAPESPASESPYTPYEYAAFDALLDGEKYEKEFVQFGEGVKGLTNHVNTQVGGLVEQVQAMQNVIAGMADHIQRQALLRELEEFHQTVNGLGEEWHDTFGQGTLGEFGESSEQGRNRRKLLAAMRAIHQGASAVGENGIARKELLRRGLHAAFHDKAVAQAEKQIEKRLKKRRDQGTARPTARHGKQLSGPERAVDIWDQARAS